MLRKIFKAIVLVPLALILIVFAVANRQIVNVSFDPFDSANPAIAFAMPLFVVIAVTAVLGVIAGGIATWVGQRRYRRAARKHETEALRLRAQLAERQALPPPQSWQVPADPALPRPGSTRDSADAAL